MTIELSDGISLAALGLSTVALGSQAVSRYRHRRRVLVSASVATHGIFAEAGVVNRYSVWVDVRSIGASAGLSRIDFEPTGDRPEGFAFGRPEPMAWEVRPDEEPASIHDMFKTKRVVQDGETLSWEFNFWEDNGAVVEGRRTIAGPTELIAVAVLVDGTTVRSPAFSILPDQLVGVS